MTSTMSLAARICSRVLEENKPAIYATRMPHAISGSKRFRKLARPGTLDVGLAQLLGHRVSGSALQPLIFLWRAFDEKKSQALSNERTRKGLIKNLRLETGSGRKEVAAINIVLEFQI